MWWFIQLVCAAALFNNAYGQNVVWRLNSAVTDLAVGPDDAIHCQLTSPLGVITFDGFGPCRVNIDRVTTQHSGIWTLSAIQPSNVLAIRQTFTAQVTSAVPTLTSQTKDQIVSEGDSVTMSCSIHSAIRYCYFRARNGTIFNVRPGMTSSAMEYVGAGLDAGECGVHFHSLAASDSGTWSCHVGLPSSAEPEQRVQFSIQVQEAISATQYIECNELVVSGVVNAYPALDYCRFVRIDGHENVPAGYSDDSSLSQGQCKLRVVAPMTLDHHPWTVVAKVTGQDAELAKCTDHTLQIPPPVAPTAWWIWLVVAAATLAVLLAFAFKRYRRWAAETATGIRDSFRKKPIDDKMPPLPAY